MDTRSLGLIGLGALAAIIVVTFVGVPPEIWIPLLLVAAAAGLVLVFVGAQASGAKLAERMVARTAATGRRARAVAEAAPVATPAKPATAKLVETELVRDGDGAAKPAVWLHRCGGRRVHRFAGEDGWTVQQVSTKDPDNPRKRVIGEPRTFAREADAMAAADDLARGLPPRTDQAMRLDRPGSATAEAGA